MSDDVHLMVFIVGVCRQVSIALVGCISLVSLGGASSCSRGSGISGRRSWSGGLIGVMVPNVVCRSVGSVLIGGGIVIVIAINNGII